jgi:hypothetical protein
VIIYQKIGMGKYPTTLIEQCSSYFAGRITFYYQNNSLDSPILTAEEWTWPEVNKFLESLVKKEDQAKKEKEKNDFDNEKYPNGIGTITFGDTPKVVYDKILKSDDFDFYIVSDNKKPPAPTFEQWTGKKEYRYNEYNEDGILTGYTFLEEYSARFELFNQDYEILFEFNEKRCLYQIKMEKMTFHRIVKEYDFKIIEEYSKKYGEPSYLNLDAVPTSIYQDIYVAKWRFKHNVIIESYLKMHENKKAYYLYFVIADKTEIDKLETAKKAKEEQQNKIENERIDKNAIKSEEII